MVLLQIWIGLHPWVKHIGNVAFVGADCRRSWTRIRLLLSLASIEPCSRSSACAYECSVPTIMVLVVRLDSIASGWIFFVVDLTSFWCFLARWVRNTMRTADRASGKCSIAWATVLGCSGVKSLISQTSSGI